MFFGCSCVSGRSEPTALLPAGSVPITRWGRGAPVRWPPRHVAIPAISTELRWMPGGAGRRANRLSLSPRHSASRQSLVPSLPGSSGTGGAGTHIAPFCPLGRGSGALKPARNVPGHEEEGGPEGGPAARGTPRSPVRRSPQPAADPTGAEPGALGVASRSYLVPGAEAAAPAAGAAAAAGPRRGCPSAGSARSERVSALLRRPVGSPFSPAAAAVIPAA